MKSTTRLKRAACLAGLLLLAGLGHALAGLAGRPTNAAVAVSNRAVVPLEPAPPSPDELADLALRQRDVQRRWLRFEQSNVLMAQRLQASPRAQDKDEAARLGKLLQGLQEREISGQLQRLVDQLPALPQGQPAAIKECARQSALLTGRMTELFALLEAKPRPARAERTAAERAQLARDLAQAEEAIRAEDWDKACRTLQQVIDEGDCFIDCRHQRDRRPQRAWLHARRAAHDRLRELVKLDVYELLYHGQRLEEALQASDAWASYELRYGAAAQQRLEAARRAGDTWAILDAIERFAVTKAARQASAELTHNQQVLRELNALFIDQQGLAAAFQQLSRR